VRRTTPPSAVDSASAFIHSAIDAARWVAFQRASETARSDAVITDHFAARFIGPRLQPETAVDCRVAFRAASIDRLITGLVASLQVDTVLNLGAGFDTRPQRLDLPASLRWIEVDDERVLEEKATALEGEPTVTAPSNV
jgi:O-methyltransferase involved in polyketide biosynthesis